MVTLWKIVLVYKSLVFLGYKGDASGEKINQ